MTGAFKDWIAALTPKERAALLTLAAIGAGAFLFVAGVAVGEVFAAISGRA